MAPSHWGLQSTTALPQCPQAQEDNPVGAGPLRQTMAAHLATMTAAVTATGHCSAARQSQQQHDGWIHTMPLGSLQSVRALAGRAARTAVHLSCCHSPLERHPQALHEAKGLPCPDTHTNPQPLVHMLLQDSSTMPSQPHATCDSACMGAGRACRCCRAQQTSL